jgi:hypothetical protein
MRRLVIASILAATAAALPQARAAVTLNVVEGRMAAARIDTGDGGAIVSITVGNQTNGIPPALDAERRACVVVVDVEKNLFDSGCADSPNAFVDDVFMHATASGSMPSAVYSLQTGLKVADSVLTYDATWTADVDRGLATHEATTASPAACMPAEKSYASAPVFVAADLALSPQCDAHATFTVASSALGAPTGTIAAVTGLMLSESMRGQ